MNYNWRKSSYSGDGGSNCVEVADHSNRVLVRDSKDKSGPMLRVASRTWRVFLRDITISRLTDPEALPHDGDITAMEPVVYRREHSGRPTPARAARRRRNGARRL